MSVLCTAVKLRHNMLITDSEKAFRVCLNHLHFHCYHLSCNHAYLLTCIPFLLLSVRFTERLHSVQICHRRKLTFCSPSGVFFCCHSCELFYFLVFLSFVCDSDVDIYHNLCRNVRILLTREHVLTITNCAQVQIEDQMQWYNCFSVLFL